MFQLGSPMFWTWFGIVSFCVVFVVTIGATLWFVKDLRYDRAIVRDRTGYARWTPPPPQTQSDRFEIRVTVKRPSAPEDAATLLLSIKAEELENMSVQPGVSLEDTLAAGITVWLQERLSDWVASDHA